MLVGSAGRATGRVEGPEGAAGGASEGLGVAGELRAGDTAAAGRLAVDRLLDDAFGLGLEALEDTFGRDPLDAEPVDRLTAERFPSSFPARVDVEERLVVLRLGLADLDLGLLAARFASVFPARLAVIRFDEEAGFRAVVRFAVDFFAVDFFAVDFFVEDFFFAGISPPSDGDAYRPLA